MVVDRYTKGVLTVIAVCLVYQCVMSMGKVVEAQPAISNTYTPPQPVVIVGWDQKAKLPYTENAPLSVAVEWAPPMKLKYGEDSPLPVSINGVKNTSGQWDALNSHVEPQPMGATPGQPRR